MGWAEKKNGNWRARWVDQDGVKKSRSGFRAEKDAVQYAVIREQFQVPDATVAPDEKQTVDGECVRVTRFPSGGTGIMAARGEPLILLTPDEWQALVRLIRKLDGTPR